MILSFILGLFHGRWQWLLLICPAGIGFELLRATSSARWQHEAGLPYDSAGAVEIVFWTVTANTVAYGAGWLLRTLFDRLRHAGN